MKKAKKTNRQILEILKAEYLKELNSGYNGGLCIINDFCYNLNDKEKEIIKNYLKDYKDSITIFYDSEGKETTDKNKWFWKRGDSISRLKWLDKYIKLNS